MFLPFPVSVKTVVDFFGHSVLALLICFGLSLFTVDQSDHQQLKEWTGMVRHKSRILIVVGAAGVIGSVQTKSAIAEVVNDCIVAFDNIDLIK